MSKLSEYNDLKTYGDLSELERIREFVIAKANAIGFSDEISFKIALAVDEACSNLIKHSFKFDRNQTITIKIESDNQTFTVTIIDNGQPFDPKMVPSPDMKEYFEHFKRGGLGVHIMKSVMDDISYISSKNTNRLILKKIIN